MTDPYTRIYNMFVERNMYQTHLPKLMVIGKDNTSAFIPLNHGSESSRSQQLNQRTSESQGTSGLLGRS